MQLVYRWELSATGETRTRTSHESHSPLSPCRGPGALQALQGAEAAPEVRREQQQPGPRRRGREQPREQRDQPPAELHRGRAAAEAPGEPCVGASRFP